MHEGFVRIEGMFNCGGARLTDLTSVLHVGSAEGQIEQRDKNTHGKIRQIRRRACSALCSTHSKQEDAQKMTRADRETERQKQVGV